MSAARLGKGRGGLLQVRTGSMGLSCLETAVCLASAVQLPVVS